MNCFDNHDFHARNGNKFRSVASIACGFFPHIVRNSAEFPERVRFLR